MRCRSLDPSYHAFILESVPRPCARALEVGCGTGVLARELAALADEAVALDRVDGLFDESAAASASNLRFTLADFMTVTVEPRYDFVCSVAALHHMPFAAALARMKDALRPGGVLAVVGLFRVASVADYAASLVAWPLRLLARPRGPRGATPVPLRPPVMTLDEIRAQAPPILPGVEIQRRLLWRYTLRWRKPR
jgi:SAM-dependent methyltransferase